MMGPVERKMAYMLNYLWGGMLILGILVGILTGQAGAVGEGALSSSKEAVTLCITMLGIMSFWTGIMQVAKAAGIISALQRRAKPLLRVLFPDIPREHVVNEYIMTNMIANVLGLGWAATPMGLKAMKELANMNDEPELASVDMCTFLIVNISSLQLIPVNIIAYRSQYGSVQPTDIIGAAILATTISTLAGVAFSIIARKHAKKKIQQKKENGN